MAILIPLSLAAGHRSVEGANLFSENFETGQTVGQPPVRAASALPSAASADVFTTVVSGAGNPMNSGNAVRFFDNASNSGINLEYNFVASATEQISAVRIDFSVAPLNSTGSGNDPVFVGVGEYNANRTFATAANRYIDLRLDNDGTVDFRGPAGTPASYNNPLSPISNRISILVNDFDAKSIDYTGPDDNVHSLPANSVAYWLNGSLVIMNGGEEHTSLDVGDSTSGGTVGNTMGNLGKFGFNSLSSDVGIDYAVDDIVITLLPDILFSEDFEAGQTPGQPPTGADSALPSSGAADLSTAIVAGNDNPIGDGNAVRFVDNVSDNGINLEYNFVDSPAEQISAVRIDFSVAPLKSNGPGNDPVFVGIGEYHPNRTFSSSANRYIDLRLDNDGTVDFRGPAGTPASYDNPLSPISNRISIFVNDFDAQPIDYTGPDDNVRSLPANSVAYWLNGSLVIMNGGEKHTSLDVGESTSGGTVGTTHANLGKFGFNSLSIDVGLDYVVDDIKITNLGGAAPPEFSSDPIVKAEVSPGDAYAATLADVVVDPDGGERTFSKVSGPNWLNLAADGTLSGKPAPEDLGQNSFVVRVSGGDSGQDEATLNINVAYNPGALVYRGASGRLIHRPDAFGNRIPDFSGVGYLGGGVPLPEVTTLIDPTRMLTVAPGSGDDQAAIQSAIEAVSTMAPDANGFRGVVQLTAGEYLIPDSLTIRAGGVILRGAGDGEDGTILRSTAVTQVNLISAGATSGFSATVSGTTHNLIDKHVPVGSTSFRVDSTAGLAVGDDVIVKRPSTAEWIADIGMDRIPPRNDGGTIIQWTAGSRDQLYERVIVRIEGDRIFIDAPLPNSFEARYGGGTIFKYTFPQRLEKIGIENLRGISAFSSATDEEHAWSFIELNRARHCWVRNITAVHFGFSVVLLGTRTSRMTCEDLVNLDPVSIITGGRRYAFNNQGALNLMTRMSSERGRHDFVNNSASRGPNVFFDGIALDQRSESGPHQRWSTGTLYDNLVVENNDLAARNRGNNGSGHGWSGANMVYWNCAAKRFLVENPFTAQNWVVGGIGEQVNPADFLDAGTAVYDSHGRRVSFGDPQTNQKQSLYIAQLNERLATPEGAVREYWLGDFDGFVNDGDVDAPEVDADWLSEAQAFAAARGCAIAGFDAVGGPDQATPFTFDFELAPDETVEAAQLILSLRRLGGQTRDDSVWLESFSRETPFPELGWGDSELPDAAGQVVVIEILGDDLALLRDGRLNAMVGDDSALDWATLMLHVNRRDGQPKIAVEGMGVEIANGDLTPAEIDGTDYGVPHTPDGTIVRTFEVRNNGGTTLSLTGGRRVRAVGAHADDFVITQPAGAMLAPGGRLPFSITFVPTNPGLRTVDLVIASDALDANPLNFRVQGLALPYLTRPRLGAGDAFEFEFATIPAVEYQVEVSVDLKTWEPLETFVGTGEPAAISDSDAFSGSGHGLRRFYRIRVP